MLMMNKLKLLKVHVFGFPFNHLQIHKYFMSMVNTCI